MTSIEITQRLVQELGWAVANGVRDEDALAREHVLRVARAIEPRRRRRPANLRFASFMCLVVTGVSFLIHVYSVAYMASDRGYRRYFSYLNFFVFSMLLLVLAGNFVILIVGWAFVGFASYALIRRFVKSWHS